MKFAEDVKYNLSKIKEHIQLNNQDTTINNIKNRLYEHVAKNTFINGIKEQYHTFSTHFDLGDIQACLRGYPTVKHKKRDFL